VVTLDLERVKGQVASEVDGLAGQLADVSRRIHERPELLFEEHFASGLLADSLEEAGFDVERGAYGLETAFRAEVGGRGDRPTVAVLCEYDALPGIGHGCGHNLIAAAGLGAGLAGAAVARDVDARLVVLGTPAEEGGGGKVLMGERGAFDDVDVALMVHPGGADLVEPDVLAIATWMVEYEGTAAHAAARPEQGRNALDAAVLGYNAVAALRQHIGPSERIHGVFHEAGTKPNIVPARAVAEWYVRSTTAVGLAELKARVLACLEAGAQAAGCRMAWRATAPEYTDLHTNRPLVERYRANSARVGRPVAEPTDADRVTVSTDMGNVSYLVPSIHPMVKVSDPTMSLHSRAFAEAAASAAGERAVLDAAKAMAMTAADLWLDPAVYQEVRAAFDPAP
jgi:amidohydrolase